MIKKYAKFAMIIICYKMENVMRKQQIAKIRQEIIAMNVLFGGNKKMENALDGLEIVTKNWISKRIRENILERLKNNSDQ